MTSGLLWERPCGRWDSWLEPRKPAHQWRPLSTPPTSSVTGRSDMDEEAHGNAKGDRADRSAACAISGRGPAVSRKWSVVRKEGIIPQHRCNDAASGMLLRKRETYRGGTARWSMPSTVSLRVVGDAAKMEAKTIKLSVRKARRQRGLVPRSMSVLRVLLRSPLPCFLSRSRRLIYDRSEFWLSGGIRRCCRCCSAQCSVLANRAVQHLSIQRNASAPPHRRSGGAEEGAENWTSSRIHHGFSASERNGDVKT